jgi:glycosyltransferase involved in cell wall biosynthesis
MRGARTRDSPPPTAGGIALVTSGDPGRLTGGYLYNRRVLDALGADGLPVRHVVLGGQHLPGKILALRAALARERPALMIVDSIAVEAAAPLVSWAREDLGTSVLALMHMRPSDLASPWRRPLLRHAERRLLRAADRVVAVSPSLGERLVEAGAAPERVVVIPPGRDGTPWPDAPPAERSGVRFLCVANWSPGKGIHTLVEALALVEPSVGLDLVGEEADRRYARRVHDLLRRHGLAERIRLFGALPAPALGERYAAADVFVLPSTSEGFGTVYAEAMTFGLPTIACRVGPLPWLVEEGRCGILVPPDDRAALAAAMNLLAADEPLRRRMGEAASHRARSLPTWRESGERFCRVVRELSHHAASPAGGSGQVYA